MAHFAQLNQSNKVIAVIVVNNDVLENRDFPQSEPLGVAFCQQLYGADTQWRQTSYGASFRKNYASIGGSYDSDLDAFIPKQPFASWILDTQTCQWNPPVPRPTDGKRYWWAEDVQSWIPTR